MGRQPYPNKRDIKGTGAERNDKKGGVERKRKEGVVCGNGWKSFLHARLSMCETMSHVSFLSSLDNFTLPCRWIFLAYRAQSFIKITLIDAVID
jgi:hypothetical protein